MAFVDVDQLSDDWLKMRAGCVSASHLGEMMKRLKGGGEAAPRVIYRKKKVMEMLTGLNADTYVSRYMEEGLDIEPLARAAYEIANDIEVTNGGLFIHDSIPRFVASPDGCLGDGGLIEIKNLTGITTEANHLDLIMGAEIPEAYQYQMLGQMACSGRQWVDFISFDQRMPKKLRMLVRRFYRDEKRIAEVEQAVEKFLAEVDALVRQLKQDDPSSLEGRLKESLAVVQAS